MSVVERAGTVERGYRRDAATWVAFGALFAFGVLNAALGPVLPYLRQEQHTSYLAGSLHQVAFAVGGMAAGLHATRGTRARRPTIVVGLVGAALAGLLLGYGRAYLATVTAAFLMSALATAALIRVWAMLADLHHRHRAVAMAEGEVWVSLAGILTPALISVCATTAAGWRLAFVVSAAVVLAAAAAVGATRLPAPRAPRDEGPRPVAGRTSRVTLVTVGAVVGLEFTVGFWAATYLHDDVGVAQDAAVAAVSALYGANLVGRLLASRLSRRLPATAVLRMSLATALVGTPLLLAAHSLGAAAAGLVVAGVGIGGTFPLASALHVAASRRSADQALGQVLFVAGIGQIVGPLTAGAVAQLANLRVALLVAPLLVLVASVTTWVRRATPAETHAVLDAR